MSRLVAVTGANGFVGRHVVAMLFASGWRVRAITRRAAPTLAGAEPRVVGEFGSAETLRAFEGCSAVVHAAGLAHQAAGVEARDPFHEANVLATGTLLDAALRAGVAGVVLVSSVAAVASSSSVRLTPEAAPRPDTVYGRSKREAEVLALSRCRDAMVPLVILRPPMIYGPAMPGNPARLFELLWRRVPLPFGALTAPRSVVGVQNFAAAVAAVLDQPATAAGVHFVADHEEVSSAEFARRAGLALGRPARLVPVPPGVLRLAGSAASPALRLLGWGGVADAVARLTGALTVDARSISRLTGFVPPLSLDEGLALAAAEFRSRHGAAG